MAYMSGLDLVRTDLSKRRRPASVRRVTDSIQKPIAYSERVTESQVRHWLEFLCGTGEVERRKGRFRKSVRYIATDQKGTK